MAKGIIYCMSSSVPGVIKIGKTETGKFEQRMRNLESDGYKNIAGWKREFAKEVKDYERKEKLLHRIFSKSRVGRTECFTVELDMVKELLASFEGTQIYPKSEDNKKISKIIKKSTRMKEVSSDRKKGFDNSIYYQNIPNEKYYLERKVKGFGIVKGIMQVTNGKFIVLKGSFCAPYKDSIEKPEVVKKAIIKKNILQNNVECDSPSLAGWIIVGQHNNGWKGWKTEDGRPLDIYRKK